MSQYTYAATILDSNDKTPTDKIQSQIDYFIFHNKRGSVDNPNFKRWVRKDIYHGYKTDGGFNMINVGIFFQSIRLSWLRRYAFGTGPANMDPAPLGDHWCDLLDDVLGVKPNIRLAVLNRGSEWLTPKLKTEHPCLSEILRTLQAIQRKWVTPPTWGDNHWEFQPLLYNPNVNFKIFPKKGVILSRRTLGLNLTSSSLT